MDFPQYRKYPNNKSYFKVLSPSTFEEIQVMGKHKFLTRFEAKIHPDRLLIDDMLQGKGHWVTIPGEEYESLRAQLED
jgi:hypothetical protein